MEQPRDKAALAAALHRERAYWEALLAVVGEDEMLLPGVTGDWTLKDVVAHLTVWRKRTIARFLGAQQGGKLPAPEWPADLGDDAQAVNAWSYRMNRDRSLAAVLDESREIWQQLVDTVTALPEAALMEPGRYQWMNGRALGPANLGWSFQHLHDHAAQINDWLARRLDES
jgi:hypothetical protein